MPKLVTSTACLQCTLGSMTAKLKVDSQQFVKIEGEAVATEKDKVANKNIPSFGNCSRSWYHPVCRPQPQPWQKTAKYDSINGDKKLTINSFCQCTFGGKIQFKDSGKNQYAEVEE